MFSLRRLQFPFHYVAYYSAWLLGVTLPAHKAGWEAAWAVLAITAVQVIWQYKVDHRVQGLFRMVALFTVVGFVVDTLFMNLGVIVFADNPFMPYCSPPWMLALWINFAVVYYAVMHILWGRYFYLGVMSAFAFPLVYLAGIRLGAVSFPLGDETTLFYGLVWVWLMPLCDYLYGRQGVCHEC